MKYLIILIAFVSIQLPTLAKHGGYCQTDTIKVPTDTLISWAEKKKRLQAERDSLINWLTEERVQGMVDSITCAEQVRTVKALLRKNQHELNKVNRKLRRKGWTDWLPKPKDIPKMAVSFALGVYLALR